MSRKELGITSAYTFNNLNQFTSGSWTGALTVIGEVNYAAGTVTVNSVTAKIFPGRVFEATNITVNAGTNTLTAVYHGPAFTNTQMIATDKVTVIVGNAAYTHDANGNLTGDQNFTYQYDLANRLTNVILKVSNVSVFAASYDGLGRRIQVVRNGTTTERYVYLPGSFVVLAILDGSNAVKEFCPHGPDLSGTVGGAGGIGGILAVKYPQQANAPTYFLHTDAMGHVILATDQQGKEVGQYRYSPFGRLLNQTGTFTPRVQYSSKEMDSESGLLNFGYRDLNPRLGRWLSRDPLGEIDSNNLYLFVRNSPSLFLDALGLESRCVPAVAADYYEGSYQTIDPIFGAIGALPGKSLLEKATKALAGVIDKWSTISSLLGTRIDFGFHACIRVPQCYKLEKKVYRKPMLSGSAFFRPGPAGGPDLTHIYFRYAVPIEYEYTPDKNDPECCKEADTGKACSCKNLGRSVFPDYSPTYTTEVKF
jgi:RHS repeat-associated protein